MKLLKNCIVNLGILVLISSCQSIPLPKVGVCTNLSDSAICTDERRPEGEQEYYLYFDEMLGYQCTSPEDYEILLKDISEKRKELAKLRRVIDSLEEKLFNKK